MNTQNKTRAALVEALATRCSKVQLERAVKNALERTLEYYAIATDLVSIAYKLVEQLEFAPDDCSKFCSYLREHSQDAELSRALDNYLAAKYETTGSCDAERPQWTPSDIGTLPQLETDQRYVTHFVGRELQLDDIANAVSMLDNPNAMATPQGGRRSRKTRLIWVSGLGGFGKSWLLRRICIDAANQHATLNAAFVDWDSPLWRRPLSNWPMEPIEVFLPIAYRLAQLFGSETLRSFWSCLETVRKSRRSYDDLRYAFNAALTALATDKAEQDQQANGTLHSAASSDPGAKRAIRHSTELERVLSNLRIRTDACTGTRLNSDRVLREVVFESWAERVAEHGDEPAAVRPTTVLCDALAQCLVAASGTAPLLLVLDTCEVLAPECDYWLMRLVTLTIASESKVLVVVGSRERPDEWRDPGAKDGWLVGVAADQRRLIAFDETGCFSVAEIEAMLKTARRPLPENSELARAVKRVTFGIPYAVRTLVDLHEDNDTVLEELDTAFQAYDDDASESKARAEVDRVVTARWLQHLQSSGSRDLEDITALGLLALPFRPALQAFWHPDSFQNRLRKLGSNHSLIVGGDLHDIVRAFLRSHWRREPPDNLNAIGCRLCGSLRQFKPEIGASDEIEWDWLLEWANIELWLDPVVGGQLFARHLCRAWAYDKDLERYIRLLGETRTFPHHAELWGIVEKMGTLFAFTFRGGEIVRWLEAQSRESAWPEREIACLKILTALFEKPVNNEKKNQRLLRICQLFEQALAVLGDNPPRIAEVSTKYLSAAFELTVNGDYRPNAEAALRWLERNGLREDAELARANLLHNVGRYQDANRAYALAFEADPKCRRHPELPRFMAHLLIDHLDDWDEGSKYAELALKREPGNRIAWRLLGKAQANGGQVELARATLRQGLKEHPEDFLMLVSLAAVLTEPVDAPEVQRLLAAALKANADHNDLNSAAWTLYLARVHGQAALDFARKSVASEPNEEAALHTLICVLAWNGEWDEIQPLVGRLSTLRYRDSILWEDPDLGPRRAVRDLSMKSIPKLRRLIQKCNLEGDWSVLDAVLASMESGVKTVPPTFSQKQRSLFDIMHDDLSGIVVVEEAPPSGK